MMYSLRCLSKPRSNPDLVINMRRKRAVLNSSESNQRCPEYLHPDPLNNHLNPRRKSSLDGLRQTIEMNKKI